MPDENTPNEEIDETVEVGADNDATDSAWNALIDQLRERGPGHTRYVFEGELARGGMGVIHRVFDRDARRRLALKVMLGKGVPPAAGDTPDVDDASLGRFLEEAQVTSQLDHPGIVPVHEIGVDETDQVYFTMKLVKGEDLRAVFDRVADPNDEEWTTTRALNVMLRVCEAMAYAHTKGVIHRDLKPGNVMVGKFGEAYVMDWGLAKIVGRDDPHDLRLRTIDTTSLRTDREEAVAATPDSPIMTMDGAVVGTPAYMPPEQATGRVEDIGPPADVYAVGAMLYHLLSGRMPFTKPGDRVSPRMILAMVAQGSPSPLAEISPHTPTELVAIVEKALARGIADRYPHMTALARDLRAYLEQRVVAAYESGAWAELKSWVRRNRALATTAATALLAVVVLAGWALVERNTAKKSEQEARAEKARVLRASDIKRLTNLWDEMDDLWPASLNKVEPMEQWLKRARALLDRRPEHETTLAALRATGRPESHEDEARHAELREHLKLDRAGESEEEFEDEAAREAHEQELARTTAELPGRIERERDHDFGDDTESQWWHDTLRDLIVGLEELSGDDDHGRTVASVVKRLEFARTIEQQSLLDEKEAWDAAITSIANPDECPDYGDLTLTPQLGLVPIGRDAESGLWEFWHVQSGARPERDDQGKLVLTEEMGLVLVLIPGGTLLMGAQSSDEDGLNYDPLADSDESDENDRLFEVALDPYFLSKYEMTQGQWLRSTGKNPSVYGPHDHDTNWNAAGRPGDLLHPVEQVSWMDCERELSRLCLVLPTEAQWEFACRAGTDTPWWTGSDPLALDEAGNVADQYGKDHGGSGWSIWENDLDDGSTVHAAVGSYRANALGLHDTIGNLWEWCLDGSGSFEATPRRGVNRGGSFSSTARLARSASRNGNVPSRRSSTLGCRPARARD